MSTPNTIWTATPAQEQPRCRFPKIDVLAQAVSRAPKRHPRHTLFLGAGASVSSGIDTAESLIKQWRKDFFKDRCEMTGSDASEEFEKAYAGWLHNGDFSQYERDAREWEQYHGQHPSEYAFLFSFIATRPFARQEKVERLVENMGPGPGYMARSEKNATSSIE